MLGMVK